MVGAGVLIAILGVLGWQWQAGLKVEAVDVVGARHADPAALRKLARVDTGAVLYDVDPELIADRVQRHPWVESVSVWRLPTGTLRLGIQERTPAALALDADGAPAYYVDAQGYCMPLVDKSAYDVPLLRGLGEEAYHPVRPVPRETVRSVLKALARSEARNIVSEVAMRPDGEVVLYTRPTTTRGAIKVRLGMDAYSSKLKQLQAFWTQAILSRPDTKFMLVDLRFDSQIITREEKLSTVSNQRIAGGR